MTSPGCFLFKSVMSAGLAACKDITELGSPKYKVGLGQVKERVRPAALSQDWS